MFGFPKSTEFNKRIPKQKFYENINISPTLKRIFVEQIKSIYWRNKLATSTINVVGGQIVTEIEVIEINLIQPQINEAVLKQIDKEIPYHILFILSFDNKYQAWMGYKEVVASSNKTFKVSKYYHTNWLLEDEMCFTIYGLNMDTIYDNLIRQIASDALQSETSKSLKDAIEHDEIRQKIQKQIESLENKIRKENQLNRQVEMNAELKKLREQLEMSEFDTQNDI